MSRTRRNLLLVVAGLCFAAAVALAAWHLRPAPPPSTADEVHQIAGLPNLGELSDQELDQWIDVLADTVRRLPPHEYKRLFKLAMADEGLREQFEALPPEKKKKLADLIPDEQKIPMMMSGFPEVVENLKRIPPILRRPMLRLGHAQRMRQRERLGKNGGHPKLTKERLAHFHAMSTPTQRAQFRRSMREMVKMLEDAGVRD